MASENKGFKHKRGEHLKRSTSTCEVWRQSPCLQAALWALSSWGGHSPWWVRSPLKPTKRRPPGKCTPRLLSHWKIHYICNKDSSVSIGSTKAWRAMNLDARDYLTEASTCCTRKGLSAEHWTLNSQLTCSPQARGTPKMVIFAGMPGLLISISLALTWLTHNRHR